MTTKKNLKNLHFNISILIPVGSFSIPVVDSPMLSHPESCDSEVLLPEQSTMISQVSSPLSNVDMALSESSPEMAATPSSP